MLDENPQFHLHAPKEGQAQSMWVNIVVPDIKETFNKAIGLGCTEIQALTEIPEMGISNAIFLDPFGYVWMLHQIHREVSQEEKMEFFEKMMEE